MREHESYLLLELDQHKIKKQKLNEENRMNNSMITDIEAALALLPRNIISSKVMPKVTKKQRTVQNISDQQDTIPLPLPYIPTSPIIEVAIVNNTMKLGAVDDNVKRGTVVIRDVVDNLNNIDKNVTISNSSGVDVAGNSCPVLTEILAADNPMLSSSINDINIDVRNIDKNVCIPEIMAKNRFCEESKDIHD